jgi:tetratricopeptide (TPR) repeat protein
MTTLALFLLLLQQAVAPQVSVQVPELVPPTRQAPAISAAESPVIREGIALFDQGKFDDALVRYEQILKANPDNTVAMYETAYTYEQKHEYQKAIDFAARGTQYSAPQLPQFYMLIGNVLDEVGQPQKAIDVYKKGIALNTPNAGTLYLNLGATYENGLRDVATAKTTFKQGALADPNFPGIHFQLANIYGAQGFKTPAFLAFTRFLVLEPNTARSQTAYNGWRSMLDNRPTPVPPQGHPLEDYVHSPLQTNEGDLSQLDAALVTSKAAATATGKSQIQSLIDQVDSLFGTYAKIDPGKDKDTFLWTYYIPYVEEMKQKGLVEPFVYFVNQRTTLPDVREWLTANPDRVNAFLQWSRGFRWPDKNALDATR